MVSLFTNLFVIAWAWLTARLKTKKHNVIRICVSSFFIIFNFIAIIVILIGSYIKEDYSVWVFLLLFYIFLLLLWGFRLISDLIFISKKDFKEKEEELSNVIAKKLHLSILENETAGQEIQEEKQRIKQEEIKNQEIINSDEFLHKKDL